VGCGLGEEDIVRDICQSGSDLLPWLERFEMHFDQRHRSDTPNGAASPHAKNATAGPGQLAREGGHSFPRVLSAGGDATGRVLQDRLSAALHEHPRITTRYDLRVVDLLVADGICRGFIALDEYRRAYLVRAGRIILASGAAGQLFRETTNPSVATGDGLAMAHRAGATLQDLEFVQFHPTTLYIAGAARVLISEAMRGAGAVLVDSRGDRVMAGKHEMLDLAPRDVVSRAILDRMVETGDTNVYLDASQVEGDVASRFPQIAKMCAAFQIDIAKDPIPVRPGAHYMIGGIRTDAHGNTDLPGLSACGEVASVGLHGANRLASNSLLEALVIGRRCGLAAAEQAYPACAEMDRVDGDPAERLGQHAAGEVDLNYNDMLYSLKSLMWRQAGLSRQQELLDDAVQKVSFWESVLLSRPHRTRKYVDLANLLLVARLVAASAGFRKESRGTHFRGDHPERDDNAWRVHSLVPANGRSGAELSAPRGATA
jgi:L-aspartate oxidase